MAPESAVTQAPAEGTIRLAVNGVELQLSVAPWTTLLDALRETLGLSGTKKGCDHGQCGACTVLVDGKRILSCLTLAVMKDGSSVTTIEGLAEGDALHPLQEAFLDCDAFQCGYCTPGQICSAVGLLAEGKARTADDIRELMSGNLCRCGAYPNIVAAIERVLAAGSAGDGEPPRRPAPGRREEAATTTRYIGQPLSRVDGRVKVTGAAKYAAEHGAPHLLHGAVVASTIAKGKITKIDASEALALEGVVHVFTHENCRNTAWFDFKYKDMVAPRGTPFRPLRDERILHSDQPIALVVAESLELARYAARLVRVEYEAETHETALAAKLAAAFEPKKRPLVPTPAGPRGDAEAALRSAEVRVEAEYIQPFEHHNPMEMHASTVLYEADGSLTIYDKTQGVHNSKLYVCNVFGLSRDEVRVVAPYVGGAFGAALRPQAQLFLAVMAALELKRPVRVEMTRREMFSFAHRPQTIQKIALGASAQATLQAIRHEAFTNTSTFEDYTEDIVNWSGMLYRCDNVTLGHKVVQLDLPTPGDMRAPGAPTGLWALESAMDELAGQLGIDPLELRLRNYAEREQNHDKPFSSKELRACYRQGAEAFGWARRSPAPRSMRDGRELIGWGMATGAWDALYVPTAAKALLTADGRLTVSSGTADIGTGTYTIMAQIAAETLGLPLESVTFELGDTTLPLAPIEGGSMTAASCGSAVQEVCEEIGKRLFTLARKLPDSPFAEANWDDATFADGHLALDSDPSRRMAIPEVMHRSGTGAIEESTTSLTTFAKQSLKQREYARNSHSAVFVEVRVDADLGTIRVARAVSAIAGGRILNPKTARSQILGGVVWGIGMALGEETVIDHQFGRILNANLAEYHIPVNADVPEIEVIFVEEHDEIVNPLGVKGLGEIGIVGVAPAIANAIHHATGVRVRELPIRLDALLGIERQLGIS